MNSNEDQNWHAGIKLLHWLVAGLIFIQIPLGLLADGWHLSPTKLDLFVWHKSIGLLILALVLVRIAVRTANGAPALPRDLPAWEALAARLTQLLLYALLLFVPLSGWVINSAANIPLRVFWWFELPDITRSDKGLAAIAKHWHQGLIVLLCLLLAMHVGAALNHHFRRRNAILKRMLPGTRP